MNNKIIYLFYDNFDFRRIQPRTVEKSWTCCFLNIRHKILENIKINYDSKNFQRRKSHIILLYKCIQILKVGNLFYEEICFIFINLVEFYYLFSCDAKNIILNNWEKF